MRPVAALLLLASFSLNAQADEDGAAIIERVEALLWGKTLQGEVEMQITTPRWQRTLRLRMWMQRPTHSFIRVVSPAKEAGIGSLRIRSEMWNYLPSVERVIKVPPSMMLQPWMGSDFTNDDLVKESSAVNDYTHRIVGSETVGGAPAYRIESLPRPEAAVVWGKVVYLVRQADAIPISQSFYNERGELVRTMQFSDVRALGGRVLPTRWEMRQQGKPGNSTVITLRAARYDAPIDPETFSERNLKKVEQ